MILRYVVLLAMLISMSEASVSSKFFKKTFKNVPMKKMMKVSHSVNNSKYLSNIVKKMPLKKIAPVDRMAHVAESIAKKSPVNSKIMKNKYPLQAMNLYAKGGDKLFKNISVLTSKTAKISMESIKKFNKKIPNFPKISKLTQKQLIDKTMLVTKATGKYGVKIIKGLGNLAVKYPKSAIAGALYGWFLSDPAGFKEALDNFGGSLEEFATDIGKIVSEATLGVASGFINGAVNYAKEHLSMQNMIILGSLFFLFLLYKLRGLFKIFTIFSRKKEVEPERKIKKRKGRF